MYKANYVVLYAVCRKCLEKPKRLQREVVSVEERETKHGIKNGVRIGVLTVVLVILGCFAYKLPEPAPQILSMISSVLAVVSVGLGLYSIHQADSGAEQIKAISDQAGQAVQKMEESIATINKVLNTLGIVLDSQNDLRVRIDALKQASTNQDKPPSKDEPPNLVFPTGEKIPWSQRDDSH